MINKKYSEFIPSMEAAEELMDQVESVSKDIDLLKSCIDNEVWSTHLFSLKMHDDQIFAWFKHCTGMH